MMVQLHAEIGLCLVFIQGPDKKDNKASQRNKEDKSNLGLYSG